MTNPLDDYIRRRDRAADILIDLAAQLDKLGLGGPAESSPETSTTDTLANPGPWLKSTAERARNGRFVVMLLGCFSSGKSTLLNALVGQPVLPVKVNPCTAILTELSYAETPSVEIRYRNGRTESLTVESFVEIFQLRTASEAEAGAEATDRFGDVERAIVHYPLPLLRNGVVLIDSPGLDDDPIRTARTLTSLPDADAVIVVLSANRFLTDLERRTLRRDLLPLGLRNLFFPVTMFDLLGSLSDDPESASRDLVARAREFLGPLCRVGGVDRFDERFFPLDARSGLQARWDRHTRKRREVVDEAKLASSGLVAFEDALERFLVQERGRAHLAHLHSTAQHVREELRRTAEIDRATARDSVDALRKRQEELEPRFRELDAIARRVKRTVDAFVSRQTSVVWQDLRDFMAKTELMLPEAVAGFDLGSLAGLDLIIPSGRARIEASLRKQLEAWLETRLSTWQSSLRPKIEASLRDLRREIAADAEDFDILARSIETDFAGGALRFDNRSSDRGRVDPVERWFSVAMGAVLLSPGAMAAGWAEGYEGALKGAASRLGIRLALLTLGALLGPVGWAGLILYVVSDAVLLVLTGGSQLKRLREQLAERLRGQLVAQVDAAKEDVFARVEQGLKPVRDGLVGAAEGEARELSALLQRTISARALAVRDAAARESSWVETLATFDAGIEELGDLARSHASG